MKILKNIIVKSSVFLLVCLVFTAPTSVFCQSQNDTAAIMQLIQRGTALTDKSPNEALSYLDRALQKSQEINYTRGIAFASVKMGKWYFGSDNNRSIALGRQAIANFEINNWGSVENKAEAHLLLAESYDEKGLTDSSAYFYYLLGAEMENGNINDPEFAIVVFTKLSIFWMNLDNGEVPNHEYIQTIQRFVEKAKLASKEIKDTIDAKTSIYFIQGAYYQGIKKYDSSRYFYLNYLEERGRLNKISLPRKISTLSNIADTYLGEHDPESAMKYLSQIKSIGADTAKAKYLAFYMVFIDFQIAKALYQQKHYADAIKLAEKTLSQINNTGSHLRIEIVEAYKIIADSYEALGDYKKALGNKNIYIKLNDSLSKKDKIDMISRLDVRYGIAEKNKELALQKLTLAEVNSNSQHKSIIILLIALFAMFSIGLFGLWRNKNIAKQKIQKQEISNLQQERKIDILNANIAGEERERTRIARELHDGIGGLISAAKMNFALAKKMASEENKDYTDGMKLLEEAGIELRQAAHNLMPKILLEEGLSAAVASFCERLSGKSQTKISFQSFGTQINTDQQADLTIYRIIQELIHNIVKHAKAKTAVVQLNFQHDGGLSVTVEDDGIGFDKDLASNAEGIGLRNIKERVKELRGKIDIQSTENGTGFYLEFHMENGVT